MSVTCLDKRYAVIKLGFFMKNFYSLVVSIFLFCGASSVYALDHYCKDPATVGRANYTCAAALGILAGEETVALGKQELDKITAYPNLKKCGRSCRKSCTGSHLSGLEEVLSCKRDCVDECFADSAKEQAALDAIRNGLDVYVRECDLSKGGSACEKREARKYCKTAPVRKASSALPPTKTKHVADLKKAYRRVFRIYKRRRKDLQREKQSMSSQVRSTVNERLGCEVIPEEASICGFDEIGSYFKTKVIEEYAAWLGLKYERLPNNVCQKQDDWVGCQASKSCAATRDDVEHKDPVDGTQCFCDEVCCTPEFNDCCSNAEASCPTVTGAKYCSIDPTTKTKVLMLGGLERYQDLFE